MKRFMDQDFLLSTQTAKKLYHEYAKKMPIIDYHCHISPQEIYEDRRFENITQIWLGADHYKWRQMRSNGIEERYITGDASDFEKFQKWAQTLEMAVGNPLYHWSHLELKNYFGYDGVLNGDTAEEVWKICNEKLKTMSARSVILKSKVEILCTTDDPIDSLQWHKKIEEDESFPVRVLPTWRPDKAMYIEKEEYLEYLAKLSDVSGVVIQDFSSLLRALKVRMDWFEEHGCKVSDHGLEYVMYEPIDQEVVEKIFAKRINGKQLNKIEEKQFKTAYMIAMGKMCHEKHWVMQLHYGVKRDNNRKLFLQLGKDAGIDCINNFTPSSEMTGYLNALAEQNKLPKTILYSLNPSDNAVIGTVIGCFQDETAIGKIQQGSAWWFNDHKIGMTQQMTSLANLGLLGNFIGMVTDSRSFLSYARHEYFRRVLCELIGSWVENGEYPLDDKSLKKIIQGISYYNAKRYFDFYRN